MAVAPCLPTVVNIDGAVSVSLFNLTMSHTIRSLAGVINIQGSSNINLENCTIEHGGGGGIAMGADISHVNVLRSTVRDVGADGISMASELAADVTIEDCVITDTGYVMFGQPAGVHLRGNKSIALRHSEVARGPYSCVLAPGNIMRKLNMNCIYKTCRAVEKPNMRAIDDHCDRAGVLAGVGTRWLAVPRLGVG